MALTRIFSSVTRYVCDHVRHYHSSDIHLRLRHLTQLVGVEESCAEAVELAELLLTQGEQKHQSLSCLGKHGPYIASYPGHFHTCHGTWI